MALETLVVAVGPNDDSRTDELTEAIIDLAEPTGARVVILHVFTQRAYDEGIDDAGFDPDDPPSPEELAARLEAVDSLSAILEEANVPYEIESVIGNEGEMILQRTEEVGGDLLLISGRQRSPTGKAVFGSTSHRIMMNSSCPVLSVREGVYSADESACSDFHTALAPHWPWPVASTRPRPQPSFRRPARPS